MVPWYDTLFWWKLYFGLSTEDFTIGCLTGCFFYQRFYTWRVRHDWSCWSSKLTDLPLLRTSKTDEVGHKSRPNVAVLFFSPFLSPSYWQYFSALMFLYMRISLHANRGSSATLSIQCRRRNLAIPRRNTVLSFRGPLQIAPDCTLPVSECLLGLLWNV